MKWRYILPAIYAAITIVLLLIGKFTSLGNCTSFILFCIPPAYIPLIYINFAALPLMFFEGMFSYKIAFAIASIISLVVYYFIGRLIDWLIKKYKARHSQNQQPPPTL